jgi:hypothetical protein
MDPNTIADRPAESPFPQRIGVYLECEQRSFGHNANMRRERPER